MMELRKVVNHPSLLGLDLDTPAYKRAVEARKAQAAAALSARGECKVQGLAGSTIGTRVTSKAHCTRDKAGTNTRSGER
jgi:hypothetical protein